QTPPASPPPQVAAPQATPPPVAQATPPAPAPAETKPAESTPPAAPATPPAPTETKPAETKPAETPPAVQAKPQAPPPAAKPKPEEPGLVAELMDKARGITDNENFLPGMGIFVLVVVVLAGAIFGKRTIADKIAAWKYRRESQRKTAPKVDTQAEPPAEEG